MPEEQKTPPPTLMPLVSRSRAFEADLKRLSRKYSSLPNDLKTFQTTQLRLLAASQHLPEALGFFPVSGKGLGGEGFFVAKRFACMSLKGTGSRSGIRLVLRWQPGKNEVLLVEIYHKGEKQKEDNERITAILKGEENEHKKEVLGSRT
jgi:hypothetical protein